MVHSTLEEKDVSGVEDRCCDSKGNAKAVTFIKGPQIDPCDEEQPEKSHSNRSNEHPTDLFFEQKARECRCKKDLEICNQS